MMIALRRSRRRSAFAELITSLSRIDIQRTPTATVQAILAALRIDDATLAPFENFIPGRYARNGVYRNDAFEIVIMCWPAGVSSAVHDHGASLGFVKVLRGALDVQNFNVIAGGDAPGPAELAPAAKIALRKGDLAVVSAGRDIHQIAALRRPAISLHVYAAPLARYLVFDLARQSCRMALPRYDIVPHGA